MLWAAGAAGLMGGAAEDPRIAELQSSVEALRADLAATGDAGLADQVSALQSEVAGLSPGGDLADIRQRLDALETAPAGDGEGAGELPADIAALPQRVEDLSSRVESLAAAPAGGEETVDLSPVTSRIDELDQRLAALEQQPEGLPQEAEDRIAALEQRLDSVAATTGTVSENADALAVLRSDLEETRALAERVPALGETFAANALADALVAGQGFAAELEAARASGIADPAVEALAGYADAGVPTIATLRARFDAEVVPALAPPEPQLVSEGEGPAEAAGSAFERILSSARGLVEVRPAAPAGGGEVESAAADRIRGLLDEGDLSAALSEWRGLPEEAKAESEGWAADAQARLAAGDLAERLRADSLTRLAPKS